ncbi:MAG: ABC transporter ATP-binding protein [Planctomycetota bacterium]
MSSRTSRALWELTQGERRSYARAAAALAASVGVAFAVPLLLKQALDHLDGAATVLGLRFGESGVLWAAGSFIVLATSVAGWFHYLRGRGAAMASERIVRRLRDRIYQHLGRLPATYHDRVETGDLLQRCSSDIETLRVFLAAQIVEIARAGLLLVCVVPLLLMLHTKLAFISLCLMPIIVVFALIFFRRVRKLFLAQDEAEGRMTAVLQENLTGIRVVRAFARQEYEQQKFDERNGEFRDTNYLLMRLMATYWCVSDILCVGQIGVCIVVGSQFMLAGEISVGTFMAFFTSVGMVIWPVRNLGRVLADTGKATVAIGRIDEVLHATEESSHETVPDEPLRGAIKATGLEFGFGPEASVLRGLDFEIRPGETLAILGPPGSGKTAIVSVLLRLYDYQGGSLQLDGHELNTLSRSYVRSQIGVVMQEPFLYSRSVGANVRVGRGDASQYDVEASTMDACVHHSIKDFEQGYETLVGERGVTLSGGQRQRVALARALLKDPPILVLDDALSAVDTKTERRILEALSRRRGRRTSILIAHRLSTVAHADRILVLEAGRIVQSGDHESLVREEGPYRRLWRIQGALEEELERETTS